MKLTCPQCDKHFLIPPSAIGVNGRTVRCSSCGTTWFVASEPDAMALRDQQEDEHFHAVESEMLKGKAEKQAAADVIERAQVKTRQFRKQKQTSTPLGQTAAASVGGALQTPHAIIRDKAEKKLARRRLFGVTMIWGVTLLILAVVAMIAYWFRASIVEKYPQTLPVYKAFNIRIPMAGLDIYDVETRFMPLGQDHIIYVQGKIKNVDRSIRDVPMLRLSFKNAKGVVINEWIVEPKKSQLKSGETIEFKTEYLNPPEDAQNLATDFITEAIEAEIEPETDPEAVRAADNLDVRSSE